MSDAQRTTEQSVDEALNVVENYIGRDWMEILTAARTLAAEVKKELARIERDNKTIERGMRRMYAALERIANFDCHPYVEADPGAIAEQTECADCKRCAERNWPPSHLCDKHYRSLICERESKQHHKEMCVKYEMKDIAREALRNE